jgi:hypothetical protein
MSYGGMAMFVGVNVLRVVSAAAAGYAADRSAAARVA